MNLNKFEKIDYMYIIGILEYLIWPAFILIAWFAVKLALSAYDRKFPGQEQTDSE